MRRTALVGSLVIIIVGAMSFAACERRPLEELHAQTALIPVKIDWSQSGMTITEPDGNGLVHRVSIRFFPKNGMAAFDRYLESNVIEGEIEVPPGEYSVVVFNESVHDIFWSDEIYFTDVNDYTQFAANIMPADFNNFPYYTPLPDEELIVEPFSLASWSLDDFTVTEDMVTRSRSEAFRSPVSRAAGDDPCNALTCVEMRRLTCSVNVVAKVENLCSAQLVQGAMRGFSNRVYMASACTVQTPATHVTKLNGRTWDDDSQTHGTTRKSFLSFGCLPEDCEYWLNLDVLFVSGELYDPSSSGDAPMLFDVTSQVAASVDPNHNINININLSLPFVKGDINVGDWEDEVIILQ